MTKMNTFVLAFALVLGIPALLTAQQNKTGTPTVDKGQSFVEQITRNYSSKIAGGGG